MPVPTTLGDLDTTAANNSPSGSEAVGTNADNYIRAHAAFIAQLNANKQATDAGLTSIAGLTTAADKTIYTTASDTYAVTDLTAFGRSLIDDADAATALGTLGVAAAALTLTNKTIATGSGNDVQTQMKIITGTRDTSAASGTQSVTGAGFTPRLIIALFGATAGANSPRIGFGLYDGATQVNFAQAGGATSLWATDASVGAIRVTDATGSTEYRGVLSFTSDGADIAWTKVGSPTGTIRFYLLCVR